jgi:hypothetical protein
MDGWQAMENRIGLMVFSTDSSRSLFRLSSSLLFWPQTMQEPPPAPRQQSGANYGPLISSTKGIHNRMQAPQHID